jgi:hypothetical protein
MKIVYVTGGVLLAGVILIAALFQADFFGLFKSDLTRWNQGIDPTLLQPAGDPIGVDDLEAYADEMDERLAVLLKEGPPAYTAEQAKMWADELIPIVERVCQREFAWRPQIRVADRAELADAAARGLYEYYEAVSPELAGPFLERAVRTQAVFESVAYLGMYDPGRDILYLAPTNVRAIMQMQEIDERHFEPFVKLIIAHELAHALQHQVVDSYPLSPNTFDGVEAYSSVIEGHAVFVSELVAHELGIDETSIEMSVMLSAGVVSIDDPMFGSVSRDAEVRFEEIYMGGRAFIAYHHEQGDMSRVWEILAAPPPTTAIITDPARYGTKRRATIQYYYALKGIEKKLGPAWRMDVHWQMTALDTHEHFSDLDNDMRDRVVAGIDHARRLVLNDWPGEQSARITLFVLRSEEDVEHYAAAVKASEVSGWTFADQVEPVKDLVVDQSRRHTHVPDAELEWATSWTHVHARRGVVIVEFFCTDMMLSDDIVAGVINTILDRIDASRDES